MKTTLKFVLILSLMLRYIPAQAQTKPERTTQPGMVVDFRYTVPWWQTLICLPDDPDKPVVGKEGQLFFDYGAGKGLPRNFNIAVTPELEEPATWLRQQTISAKTPLVQTHWDAKGVEVLSEVFQQVPTNGQETVAPPWQSVRLDQDAAPALQRGWAKPQGPCDPAFADVAVGFKGARIAYDVKVPTGKAVKVVFGLCEGWWDKPGQRVLKLAVEGGKDQVVDPSKDFGKNRPGLYVLEGKDTDGNGKVRVVVSAAADSPDDNTILNVLWVFTGELPERETILHGEANAKALAYVPSGQALIEPHRYAVLLSMKNATATPQKRSPIIRLKSNSPIQWLKENAAVTIGGQTRLLASEAIEECRQIDKTTCLVRLAPQTIPAGETRQVALTILRHGKPALVGLTAAQAEQEKQRAIRWWESADLPWDAIQVPDPDIQALLVSCVRNIWQAREIKNGLPAFHVGPTCYRGLWVVDGSFLLEAAAIVGRARDARGCIQYVLSHQQPDGRILVMGHGLFHMENGITLWMCCRHAALTQDKAWLESIWPRVEKIVGAIKKLREESRTQPPGLQAGLMPTGFVDGGIGGNLPNFANVYWNLTGMKAAIDAARWLGKNDQAETWGKEYEDFLGTYRKAAAREMGTDPAGNRFVPTIMGEQGKKFTPQRGQWAFMHSVYPGQVFAKDDPLVQGNLAMLKAVKQQGLVFGTGWDAEGIWTYAASFYGHVLLWLGHGREAAQVLYDYANHAAPVRVWREEQRPLGKGGHEVGDMPHNWASAEFIRLATHLLALDRGTELHLLEGLPRVWAGPGMVTRLKGVATPFGPLHLTLTCDPAGKTAELEVQPLAANCTAIIVHLPDGGNRTLQPTRPEKISFSLNFAKE